MENARCSHHVTVSNQAEIIQQAKEKKKNPRFSIVFFFFPHVYILLFQILSKKLECISLFLSLFLSIYLPWSILLLFFFLKKGDIGHWMILLNGHSSQIKCSNPDLLTRITISNLHTTGLFTPDIQLIFSTLFKFMNENVSIIPEKK